MMKRHYGLALFALVVVAFAMIGIVDMIDSGKNTAAAKKHKYPEAKKEDVSDNYHGTIVQDPYRWLEDPESEETLSWVGKQNALTREFIDSYPDRASIEARMTELWNYPKYTNPSKHGDRYFFSKNDGLQNQSVLYMQESLDGEATVVIDPNGLSADGTVALSNQRYSHDGTLLVYALSSSGSDWQRLRIRNLDTLEDYPDELNWCKFSGIGWRHDNAGFWYSRFPAEGEVPPEDRNNFSRVYWHQLGTDQSEDVLVFDNPEEKELGFWPFVTEDGEYLVLFVYHGTDNRNGIYFRKTGSDGEFIRLMEPGDAKYSPIDNIGSTMYFETDLDADRGRIIAVDLNQPDRSGWREVIPAGDDVVDFTAMVNNHFVVTYMHDAHHQVKIFDLDGKFVRDIELPTIGSIGGLSGDREGTEMFFSFTSYVYPTTAYHYDFEKDKMSVFRQSEIDFDPSGFETKQVFYESKDGTKVPMFITHKKGIELDGRNPTILYGYGGFNISLTPYFSVTRLVWLEAGGVFAVANLRGGDEYGEEWHQAGMLERKQNVFDDFIAGAEHLIEKKYTNESLLAINGGSNGGLLVAACMLQRPDLYGAVVCQVPVIDMLRYHVFTVGRYWVPEYGNAEENPEHFKFLMEYSPLHNIKEGVQCPSLLITSADTDDRVVPAHAKKFAAALQAADVGDNPILLRVETKAGHGGGKPTTMVIEEYSDIYAFLFKVFDMKRPNL